MRRFILFHDKRHPVEMGAAEVEAFLTHLAVEGKVAAATQNQALSALLFLYREVLEINLPWLDQVVRAKRPARLPVVLTRQEVTAVLNRMSGVYGLLAHPAVQKAESQLNAARHTLLAWRRDLDMPAAQPAARTPGQQHRAAYAKRWQTRAFLCYVA